MNPGMVVKLRPAGPWRIGPDSGARNRVDAVYHSDALYGAVTSAMAVLGSREEWLDATARASAPAVCFSSCFPFVDEIGFVAPPRTVWPPASPAATAGRVRWRSAKFVPLGIVQSILAGQRLDDGQWTVDGASECLMPVGRPGPFRTGIRWNAAVDRLTGATERHSTACLEFRPGAGLWTVVSFADEAARERWSGPVKAAFRWLADSGFGGERSRGWGRSETPEFVEGTLPEMILPATVAKKNNKAGARGTEAGARGQGPGAGEMPAPVEAPPAVELPIEEVSAAPVLEEPPVQEPSAQEEQSVAPDEPPVEEPSPVVPVEEPATEEPPVQEPPAPEEQSAAPVPDEPPVEEPSPVASVEESLSEEAQVTERPEVSAMAGAPGPRPLAPGPQSEAPDPQSDPGPRPPAPDPQLSGSRAHWLLSLYTPAADDAVDWARGNYSMMTRGGRVDASGELKKQLPMVAEGSVLFAAAELRGSAPDVAPDGFAHPVFRAGFAVSIPLPEAAQ